MKYYIVAGEASGDLHASRVLRGLKRRDPAATFRGVGGDLMRAEGAELVRHLRDTAFMGLEVLFHLPNAFRMLRAVEADLLATSPDVLLLVDYPGFNLRLAEFAHRHGIRVFYFIAPKVWAWNERRVAKLRRFVDRLFAILPFEVEYFAEFGIRVEYHGNPLVDAIDDFRSVAPTRDAFVSRHGLSSEPILALVPGSRRSEIRRVLPAMLRSLRDKAGYQLVVAGAPSIPEEFYREVMGPSGPRVVHGDTYAVIAHAMAAVVTSGTATLETALLGTPEVVVYKAPWLTYLVARLLVSVRHFSLVNLIAGREVVKELLQFRLERDMRHEVDRLLGDTPYRQAMLNEFRSLAISLGEPRVADRVAARMVELLGKPRGA